VQPTGLPPRAAEQAGPPAQPAHDDGRALQEEVVQLARSLPGDLRRLTLRNGDHAIEVEWAPGSATAPGGSGRPTGLVPAGPDGPRAVPPEVPDGLRAVRTPLVGTFYASPSPGADPFVRPGDQVEAGQTVGIVEAMKLMNPILAEEPGVVAEVRVGNAESVEYDQVLLLLRPAGGPR
jgi:acetyl-CoA carboxylase biotin carboxyl carrier protein